MLLTDDLRNVIVSPEEILKQVEIITGAGAFASRERVSYYRVLYQIGEIIHCERLIRDRYTGDWVPIYNESFTAKDLLQGMVRRIGYDVH